MSANKTESLAEYKLVQKIIDGTKKMVNIVAIGSFLFGIVASALFFNIAAYEYPQNRGAWVAFILLVVFYLLLLWIVNRGLNKYKELD